MKQFNNTAILTSKNPEAFLNFTFDTTNYWIIPECTVGVNTLFVNGLDINDYAGDPSLGYALLLDSYNDIASFHVYTSINSSFDANLIFHFYDSDTFASEVSTHNVLIKNRPFITGLNTLNNEDILVDDQASYLLMRTNPKFTGNIKLYVDGSNNLYLDTFKVSDTLSNKKYRHQQRSANSVLSSDIRNIFADMPLGELYRVDVDNTLSIGIPKTNYANQYNTTYNYGARLLVDELYPEDNGLLAPLWINSQLPDYFAVFRLPGNYNQETYDGATLANLAFKYLEESKLIKSWSLKPAAPLGKYLNTHLSDLIKIQAPVFLSLTDPDIAIAESDPNTWYGIAVDKGVLTGRSETTYFFNQNAENLTDLDAFVSQGFERNTLLCPNLINLEYIFSDEDVSLYSMSRYFGFYLAENILYNIAYYADSSSGPISILSLDGKDSSVFMHSTLFDASGNIAAEYRNRIFILNDEVQLQRITNANQINETQFNKYVSKPYKNIFTTPVEKTNIAPFITLTLNTALEQGEHLRLINKTQNKIWEIFSVDASSYKCETYCTTSENPGYPTVYRTYFDMNGTISYQIQQIESAFDRFGDYEGTQFRSGVRGNNWVSLVLNDDASFGEEWMFQRISAPTLNDFNDPSSGFNSAATAGDITFFGRFTPNASDFNIVEYDSSYGPIDFELFGDRQSIMINLINRQNNNLYSFATDQNILDKLAEPTLYQGNDLWYRRLLDMDVSNNMYLYVKDPLHIDDKVLIMAAEDILLFQNKFNAYSIYPLNISLMGINPVKDIDYTVYDSSLGFKSEYWYNRDCDVSTYYISVDAGSGYILDIQGSYVIKSGIGTLTQDSSDRYYIPGTLLNTFDSSLYISATTSTLITYAVLDGSYNYKGYDTSVGVTEEHLSDYYVSNTLLKYGLTIPLVSKWVGLGTDCRNNPFRLILDASIFDVSTNFIPTSTSFSQEISYPSFKYIGVCGRAWQDYVFYDINDVVNESENLTFKDAIFDFPYVDYFSKLVYSNYNVDATKTRSSIVYYNGYKNTIDTIFLGLNLSIQVENIAKNILDIKNYDRYRFSFISTSSKNKDNKRPIEVIINENTKTILMIWYQGNDELNYNMRYSSFLPGKSLFDPSDRGFVTGVNDKTYSFVKTPYVVNNANISKSLVRLYGIDLVYDSSTARPYAQLNKNQIGINSVWNAFGNNVITGGGVFQTEGTKNYETFNQYVDYNYAQNPNTYNDYVTNYGYNYNNNENRYVNNTTNYDTLKYLLSTSFNYVMYYIIRGDEVYTSYNFGGLANPMSITINSPRSYRNTYTYNGWFKPKFNSILDFKSDETKELVEIVKRDFIFSNTNLRLYNDIPQLWYNKVVDTVTQTDISVGNAISYATNFNVFKALWDANYYFNSDSNTYVAGYESPRELPSFFGSKLVKLPDNLDLENWDSTTTSYTQSTADITLSFNLTRAILSKFKSNYSFINNWSGLSNADNIIDAYIKNTVVTYYNLSVPKIKVDFYFKSYDGQKLHYLYDSSFTNDNKQNFNGQLIYQNDEYIYKMIVPITGNYSYFVKFTMTEK